MDPNNETLSNIRPLKVYEQKYTYPQSQQLNGETGFICSLSYPPPEDSGTALLNPNAGRITDEFKQALERVTELLHLGKSYSAAENHAYMLKLIDKNPKTAYRKPTGSISQVGLRIDSDKYAFLARCNISGGNTDAYLYCYLKKYFDNHIENANRDIRFIDSRYRDLFRLPDGAEIILSAANGEQTILRCRYIDSCHVEIGKAHDIWHICQFAEFLERNGASCKPKETPLPQMCFSYRQSTGQLIRINRYEDFTPVNAVLGKDETPQEYADKRNAYLKVTKAQAAAMEAGINLGWNSPEAQPKSYDENSRILKSKIPDDRSAR